MGVSQTIPNILGAQEAADHIEGSGCLVGGCKSPVFDDHEGPVCETLCQWFVEDGRRTGEGPEKDGMFVNV